MKNLKSTMLCLLIILAGCNNHKSVDSFLDDYEKNVVKWEEKSQEAPLTQKDFTEISNDVMKMEAYQTELKDKKVEELTPEQQQRMIDLAGRLSVVVSKIKMDGNAPLTDTPAESEKTEDK
jgi:hypothetical protein